MRFYYIIAKDPDTDVDLDLLTFADGPVEAARMWRAYYDAMADVVETVRVIRPEPTGLPGALGWGQNDTGGIMREVTVLRTSAF